jgi:hypothetical protein
VLSINAKSTHLKRLWTISSKKEGSINAKSIWRKLWTIFKEKCNETNEKSSLG